MKTLPGYRVVRRPEVNLRADIVKVEFCRDVDDRDDGVMVSMMIDLGTEGLVHPMDKFLRLRDAVSMGIIEYDTATGRREG